MWKIRIFWKENGSPAPTGGFHLDPGSNSHGHFVSNVIVRRCEQYYFVSEKDLTKCEQLEWIPSFHWWFPSCSWSQFPRTARDRRTCKELTGSTQLLNDFYQSQKFWEQKKSSQSVDLTFALKVRFVRCTYRTTASRCSLDPLKISFVGIFCFLTLLLKQKPLSVSFDVHTPA